MTIKNIESLSMQELWGGDESLNVHDKIKRTSSIVKQQYCLYLGDKKYVALSNTSDAKYMIVFGMQYADTFDSREEAERINREIDAQATLIEYHNKWGNS